MEPINIEAFKKLDIRVGRILSAEKVEGADRLLKLSVSFGGETRQIISGIAAYYQDPAALVGVECAFAYNLAPRVIRGLESQGMILAATGEDGSFSLLTTTRVPPGSMVR